MLELEVIDIKRTGIIVYLHFSAGCVQSIFAGDLCITLVNLQPVPTPIACTTPAASIMSFPAAMCARPGPCPPYTLCSVYTSLFARLLFPRHTLPFYCSFPDYFPDFSTCSKERVSEKVSFLLPKMLQSIPQSPGDSRHGSPLAL